MIEDTIINPRQGFVLPPASSAPPAQTTSGPPPAAGFSSAYGNLNPAFPGVPGDFTFPPGTGAPGGSGAPSDVPLPNTVVTPPPPGGGTTTAPPGGTWQTGNIDFTTPEGQSIATLFQQQFGNPYADPNSHSGSTSLTNSQWIIIPANDTAGLQQARQQAVDPNQFVPLKDANGNIVAYARSDKNIRPEFQSSPHTSFWERAERPLEIGAALGAAYFLGPEILGALAPEAAGAYTVAEGLPAMAGPGAFEGGIEAGATAGLTGGLDAMPFIGAPEFNPMADIPTFADSLTPAIDSLINIPTGGVPESALTPLSPLNAQIPGATGPGIWDRMVSGVVDHPLQALGLGLTGATMLGNHPSGVPSSAANTAAANQPLGNQARTDLMNRGQLSPDQRGTIDSTIEQQWTQGSEAIIQASINAGQGGKESMVVQDKLRAFKGQLETMRQQLYMKQAEQNILNALQELGLVDQEQFLLANLELQQNTAAQNRATSIMRSLGWLWSVGNSGNSSSSGGTG